MELVEKLRGVSQAESRTLIWEHAQGIAERSASREPQERVYLVPAFGDGGRVSHRYTATEEEVFAALERINVEAQYLREQMQGTRDAIAALSASREQMDLHAFTSEWQDLQAKLDLLKSMRNERMRESEVLKLEYETQKRMGDSRPAAAPRRDGNIF